MQSFIKISIALINVTKQCSYQLLCNSTMARVFIDAAQNQQYLTDPFCEIAMMQYCFFITVKKCKNLRTLVCHIM